MPQLSIIIRSYNEADHIGKLISGIQMQTVADAEIILVDSGSTDSTVDIARSFGVKIVHIPKAEFSFGRALNLGCRAAKGQIFVFASAHVYPLQTDWLEKLVAPFKDPKLALSYGRQTGDKVTKFSEQQIFESWFPIHSNINQQHNFCNNANCAIRRDIWLQQEYDEDLPGLEDLAWAKQLQVSGHKIAYVADAIVAHVHEETWNRVRNRYRREAMALRKIEPKINFGFGSFLWLLPVNIISDFRAAFSQGKLLSEFFSILLFRSNQIYGTWRGHQSHRSLDQVLRERFYYPASEGIEIKNDDSKSNLINYEAIAQIKTRQKAG
jgi:rhamnosyltransferase